MPAPRIVPGRTPADLNEMMVDIAGMQPEPLAQLAARLREFFTAKTGAAELVAEDQIAALYPLPEPHRDNVMRLGIAYESVTGDRLLPGRRTLAWRIALKLER